MKKIAIVIGHAKDSKGACSPYLPCEFDYNKKVAEELKSINSDKYTIYEHGSYRKGYYAMVKETSDLINREDFDLVLELHYNAASPIAHGTEVLYYFASKKGKVYAEILSNGLSKALETKNRGIRPLYNKNDRGFQAVYLVKPPALIVEPFFGTNEFDCLKFQEPNRYAQVLDGIINDLK